MINNPASWMQEMWDVIGHRPLRAIVLPATHDSGISTLARTIGPSIEANTRTQEANIGDQLKRGARVFDIRPILGRDGQTWYLCHGAKLGPPVDGFVGGLGESLDVALGAISEFAADHPKELIILRIRAYPVWRLMKIESLGKIETVGKIRDINVNETNQLLSRVEEKLRKAMVRWDDSFVRLADLTPDDLTRDGGTVLCVFEGLDFPLVSSQRGFFSTNKGALGELSRSAKYRPGFAVTGQGQMRRMSCAYVSKDSRGNEVSFLGSAGTGYLGGGSWEDRLPNSRWRTKKGLALAAGPDGTLFALYVADDDSNGLYLRTSGNGGRTWSLVHFELKQATEEEPSLAVGRDGTLYAAYRQRGGNTFWLTKSSDRGATWQFRKEVEVDGVKPTGWGPSLVVDAEGNLYLLYVGSGAANKLMMVTTKDPGKSWSRVGDLGGQTTGRRPSLAIGSKNALYILYTEGTERKSYLRLTYSPDGGRTWMPGQVSFQPDAQQRRLSPHDQRLTTIDPTIAVSGGKIYALYADTDDRLYLTSSEDHGGNWSPKTHFPPTNLYLLGDYANKLDTGVVISDQKTKMREVKTGAGVLFEVSWIVTQADIWEQAGSFVGINTIQNLAAKLAKAFPDEMRAWVKQGVITKSTKPNFISFDYFKSDLMETIEYLNRL